MSDRSSEASHVSRSPPDSPRSGRSRHAAGGWPGPDGVQRIAFLAGELRRAGDLHDHLLQARLHHDRTLDRMAAMRSMEHFRLDQDAEISRLRTEISRTPQIGGSQLQDQLRLQATEIENTNRRLSIAQREFSLVDDQRRELEHQLELAYEDVEDLRGQVSAFEHELDRARDDISSYQGSFESVRDALSRSEAEVLRSRADLDQLAQIRSDRDSAAAGAARLESNLQRATEELQQARSAPPVSDQAPSELTGARSAISNLTRTRDSSRADLETARQDLSSSQADLTVTRTSRHLWL
ncbi:hypothetical protein PHYPSEUDO_015299 [Phytophthora pseudosyringae]|uniref:Uncharacterized protein n=1 Tax=Phytophthora pseudosyringae TaxID=221518 RepID=A0A8T1V6R6_9STRA|nr:hypothetical protein PHYPSEUDO_015299 [Phytophthora pseudosyringae]